MCGALALGGMGLPALFGDPVGAATTSSLAPFLLKSGEEPGFTVSGGPTTIATPSGLIASGSLTKSESKSFVSTLRKAGFVKAVEENTKGSGSNETCPWFLVQQPSPLRGGSGAVPAGGQVGPDRDEVLRRGRGPGSEGCHRDGRGGWVGGTAYWSAGGCDLGSGAYEALVTSAKAAASPVQAGIRAQAKRVGTTCP